MRMGSASKVAPDPTDVSSEASTSTSASPRRSGRRTSSRGKDGDADEKKAPEKGRGFKEKRAALRSLIRESDVNNAIVFCNRKRDVSTLEKSLRSHGFNAAGLHGDMHQSARMETLAKFRDGEIKLLVASDVAARGLDIPNMSHVFNFDVPMHAEDYIHRIGRTGRAGASGVSISFACEDDAFLLPQLEQAIGMKLNCVHPETALVADQ